MALLERVTTLIKANLNDLVDQAENPEKLLKQLLLDMENQYMQVKTQLAMAIADQHLLEKRRQESLAAQREWVRKAELALQKQQEDLARSALERSLGQETAATNFAQQIEDQSHQVQMLKDSLHRLEQKMAETRTRTEVLLAQHRRARTAARSGSAAVGGAKQDAAFDRMSAKILQQEALGVGHAAAFAPGTEERFAALEREDKVDRLLEQLKTRALPPGGDNA